MVQLRLKNLNIIFLCAGAEPWPQCVGPTASSSTCKQRHGNGSAAEDGLAPRRGSGKKQGRRSATASVRSKNGQKR